MDENYPGSRTAVAMVTAAATGDEDWAAELAEELDHGDLLDVALSLASIAGGLITGDAAAGGPPIERTLRTLGEVAAR